MYARALTRPDPRIADDTRAVTTVISLQLILSNLIISVLNSFVYHLQLVNVCRDHCSCRKDAKTGKNRIARLNVRDSWSSSVVSRFHRDSSEIARVDSMKAECYHAFSRFTITHCKTAIQRPLSLFDGKKIILAPLSRLCAIRACATQTSPHFSFQRYDTVYMQKRINPRRGQWCW